MITKLAISGYRSPRDVRLGLGALNVVTGANGSGKSSLYRAVRLLADIAQGRIIQSLAAEGGLHSTLWAGPESFSRAMKKGEQPVQGTVRKASVSLKLGFAGKDYWLRDRSRLAHSFRVALRPRSGDQGGAGSGKRSRAPTRSPCAMVRALAFATKPARGGKSPRIWRRSTA